jgi:hypothetical protein
MDNFLPVNDGIDHINVYSKSKTTIGRQLSNFAATPFTYNGLNFSSVEAAWYFFKTGQKHHFLRELTGFAAKRDGKRLERIEFPEFNETILECIRCKFRQNKKLLMDFAATSLPLSHYYYWGEEDNPKIVRLPQYQWIVDELERIRKLTKEWLSQK